MKINNKIIALTFLLLPLSAFPQTQQAGLTSDFYQKFTEAAWLQKNHKNADALKLFIQLDETLPKDPAIVKSIVELAIDKEDAALMAKYAPVLIEAAPQDPAAISLYATWLWSTEKYQDALSYFKKAVDLDPENPETIFKYATLMATLDGEKALAFLKDMGEKYPRISGLVTVQIADIYMRNKAYGDAEKYYKQAEGQMPYLSAPYYALGLIYESKGDVKSALAQYLSMEEVGLADAAIYTKIGACYVLLKQKDLSYKYFLKAVAEDKHNGPALKFLSLYEEEEGNFEQALAYLKESEGFDKTPSDWVRASYLLSLKGDTQASAEVLREAYKKFDKDGEVAYYYIFALIDEQDYKTARAAAKELLKQYPNEQTILFQYAFVLERLGKYKDMEKALLKILELNPTHADALNFLGYYLVDKTDRLEQGGTYVKKAVAIKPQEGAYIDSLGWYFYKKGDYKQAMDLLLSISDDALTQDSEIAMHLASVYEAQKDFENAKKYYAQVLEADPKNKAAKKGLKRSGGK